MIKIEPLYTIGTAGHYQCMRECPFMLEERGYYGGINFTCGHENRRLIPFTPSFAICKKIEPFGSIPKIIKECGNCPGITNALTDPTCVKTGQPIEKEYNAEKNKTVFKAHCGEFE